MVNMINILGSIPKKVTVACSGGPDSMAVLDFLVKGKKDITVAHFNHGTDHGNEAFKFVQEYCKKNNITFISDKAIGRKPTDKSLEEWWRDIRYAFFKSLPGPIITAHQLDDVAEWWIFTSLNGGSRLIPYRNGEVFRPFLTTPKQAFISWCDRKDIPYIHDPSNINNRFARGRIRNDIMPEALKINPGFLTVIKKRVEEDFKNYE